MCLVTQNHGFHGFKGSSKITLSDSSSPVSVSTPCELLEINMTICNSWAHKVAPTRSARSLVSDIKSEKPPVYWIYVLLFFYFKHIQEIYCKAPNIYHIFTGFSYYFIYEGMILFRKACNTLNRQLIETVIDQNSNNDQFITAVARLYELMRYGCKQDVFHCEMIHKFTSPCNKKQ